MKCKMNLFLCHQAFSPVDVLVEPKIYKYELGYVSDTSEGTIDYEPENDPERPYIRTRSETRKPAAEGAEYAYKPVIVNTYPPRPAYVVKQLMNYRLDQSEIKSMDRSEL